MTLAAILSWGFSGLAAIGLVYLCAAIVLVGAIARRRSPLARDYPSATVLKPLHGNEPRLFDNLASFVRQDYPAPVQVIFGVQRVDDPAIAVVRDLQTAWPGADLHLVVDARLHGSNRKVSNLVNMSEGIRHEMVVLADSDMVAGPDYLRRLAGELARPGVGAVTCLYHGLPASGVWSRLSALAIDTHFLPSVAVGIGLGLAKPCFGSTIAMRRETLEAIGGFRAVADDLADDYVIGAKVRQLGLEVAATPFSIGHVCSERSFAELARQELRWVRTIRQIDPAGHAGSLVSHPLPFGALALALAPGLLPAGLVGAAICLRVGLCLAVERAFGVKRHAYWLVPARDLLSFGMLVASFFSRAVSWRGQAYDVTADGVLTAKTRH